MIKKIIYDYLYDKTLIDNQKEKTFETVNHWSPSDFCSCLRKVFFKKINHPVTNPINDHQLLKWEMGNGIHYQLKDIYKRIDKFYKINPKKDFNFEYIENENNFINTEYQELKFIYKPDDIIKVNDKIFIIENKTKYGQGIDSVINYGIEKDYEIQILLYMIFENIEYGEFFFVATDSAYNQDFAYTRESLLQKYQQEINERIKIIKICLDEINKFYLKLTYEMPKKEGNINIKKYNSEIKFEFQKDNIKYKSYPCTWSQGSQKCQWFDFCNKDLLAEIKNHNFYINGIFYD
jgi:hypothetical protein